MSLSFVFENDNYDQNGLQQGDILQRTEKLREAIRMAHPYYADGADDYHFFMVLTQSCDLIRRKGRSPKSRHITLAAIRPLQILLSRELEKHSILLEGFPIKICNKQGEIRVQQLLERLLNNTEQGYFFIRKGSQSIFEIDYCVFLSLTIALRAQHYDACCEAKVAQLKDVFQAKVGWLAGNLYSRVGTPDIGDFHPDPERYKNEFFRETLEETTVWLTAQQRRQLKEKVKHGMPKNAEEASSIIGTLDDDMQTIASRVADRLIPEVIKDQDLRSKILGIISSDKIIKRVLISNE